ncbi:hypothetical protein TNIN_431441 [Trichonephila inaurata madagascariensis]|uniref:Uncharacterized protein n=1 Tax=Trichonephila inaurata madagascariensis TaxID=2747483 RepID=A0A8X6IW17_9ARAC|nr:hypothetical protein TNIN_431441 [Trichonephila inaurata madagascariensis]
MGGRHFRPVGWMVKLLPLEFGQFRLCDHGDALIFPPLPQRLTTPSNLSFQFGELSKIVRRPEDYALSIESYQGFGEILSLHMMFSLSEMENLASFYDDVLVYSLFGDMC